MGPAFLLPYLGCPPSSLPVCHHYGSEGLPKEKGRARREPQASPGGCSAPARDVEGSQAEALPACSGALALLTAESASPPGRPRPLLEGPAPQEGPAPHGRPRPLTDPASWAGDPHWGRLRRPFPLSRRGAHGRCGQDAGSVAFLTSRACTRALPLPVVSW